MCISQRGESNLGSLGANFALRLYKVRGNVTPFSKEQWLYLYLQKEGRAVDDIDDANGQDVFEEYEWAGQTRIRATTLLEGGFRGRVLSLSKGVR